MANPLYTRDYPDDLNYLLAHGPDGDSRPLTIHDADYKMPAGKVCLLPMTVYQALEHLIDLQQRLTEADRRGTTRDAEAIGFGLRAIRAIVQFNEAVEGGRT